MIGWFSTVVGFEHVIGPPFQFLEGHRAPLVGTGQFDANSQKAERLRPEANKICDLYD
jgi:hypothetical protein